MLRSLPPSLSSGPGLTRLVVNHNALGSMPMGVAGLRELRVLDVGVGKGAGAGVWKQRAREGEGC